MHVEIEKQRHPLQLHKHAKENLSQRINRLKGFMECVRFDSQKRLRKCILPMSNLQAHGW